MSDLDEAIPTDAGLDIWRVQLATGEVRAMTLDELDAAYNSNLVDERTPVLEPGSTSWSRLGEVAGLEGDAPAAEPHASVGSLGAVATPVAAPTPMSAFVPSVAPVAFDPLADATELDVTPDAFKKGSKAKVAFGLVGAALVLAGVGLAATKLGASDDAAALPPVTNALAATAAAAAPPPTTDLSDVAKNGSKLTDEQREKLLEADKAREAKRAAEHKARAPRHAPRRHGGSKSGPFLKGGDKYDPLNGAL